MKLSILICTIPERAEKFAILHEHMKEQIRHYGLQKEVEVLNDQRPRKELSVGAKRQSLLERAKGDFVVFIDDDDMVPFEYSKRITDAISADIDCIGFKIMCYGTDPKGKPELAAASNKYPAWADNVDGYRYVRMIYHKTPHRREHALAIGYRDMRFAEDADYSKRLKDSGLLVNEVFIPEVMYEYRFKFEDPRIKYGI